MAEDSGPSLEALIESGDLPLGALHPGGEETTLRLAGLCGIGRGTRVLDVASGRGETACLLARELGAEVTGVEASPVMVEAARRKAEGLRPPVTFEQGDAHDLGYPDASFDVVISECTLCLLDKEKALAEMVRVARPGGRIGMHDLCWREGASAGLRARLAELEGERPETLSGWRDLFARHGLTSIETVDLSELVPAWMRETTAKLGWTGQLRLFGVIVRRWGPGGLLAILRSERVFRDPHLGYGLVVGTKG